MVAEKLEMTGSLVSELVIEELSNDEKDLLNTRVQEISEKLNVGIGIIDSERLVIVDSEGNLDHRKHHEIGRALSGVKGRAVRLSKTTGIKNLYVALPLFEGDCQTGVVRVSMPLLEVNERISHIYKIIIVCVFFAILIAVILSFIVSRTLAKPLVGMKNTAEEMLGGDYGKRLDESSKDEVGMLARSFNTLFDEMQKNMSLIIKDREDLSTILASMTEGVLVLDREGQILVWNQAFKDMFETEDNLDGKGFSQVIDDENIKEIIWGAIKSPDPESIEVVSGEGEDRVFLIQLSYIESRINEITGMVIVFHDISQIKKFELIRSDFISNVSHELKTPITAIGASAETLLSGNIENLEEMNRFIRIIQGHSLRLNNIVNDLLLLSKIESEEYVPGFKALNLEQILRKSLLTFEEIIKKKNLELEVEIPEDIKMVLGVENNIEQVVVNLIDNAVKFTPEGGEIKIALENQEETVVITVSDSGIGIPANHFDRIFERFYRVDTARSREIGGTGLGLSIVKHIVQLHEGKITVRSQPRKGTEFRVILPSA